MFVSRIVKPNFALSVVPQRNIFFGKRLLNKPMKRQ